MTHPLASSSSRPLRSVPPTRRARTGITGAVMLGSVLAAAACGDPHDGASRPPAKAGEPIAKIGSTTLTVEQLQGRLDEQSPFVRARYADKAKKKEFLDAQVRFEVLAAEAFTRGLDKDPEVLEAIKKIVVQKLTREQFDAKANAADVTDAELAAYFDKHQAEYQKPEMVRVSAIVIAATGAAAAEKKQAADAQKAAADKSKIEDRNAFKDLVMRYSNDELSKKAAGDFRYLTREDATARFGTDAAQWLFAGEAINEVGPVFNGPAAEAVNGVGTGAADARTLLILKRTAKRKAIARTFDQVKNQIKNVVFREKRTAAFEAFVAELNTKHGVEVYADKPR